MSTYNLGIDFLLQNQSSPEITINEAIEKLDAIIFHNVQEVVGSLPSDSTAGMIYILNNTHAMRPNQIAVWIQNKGWQYIEPKIGWVMYIVSTQERIRFTENGWQAIISSSGEIPELHDVAQSGSYNDLNDKPHLHSVSSTGDYNDLSNKPYLHSVASSGNYNELQNTPFLHTVAQSGSYNELNDKPVFHNICWSGDYEDLINKPTISSSNSPSAFIGQFLHGQMANEDFSGWIKWTDGRQLAKAQYLDLWNWANINNLVGATSVAGKFFEDTNTTTFTLHGLSGRSVITSGQGTGLTNRNLGDKFGEETHALTIDEMPSHSHDVYNGALADDNRGFSGGDDSTRLSAVSPNRETTSTGGDQPHNNIQPSTVLNSFIYAGV